MSPETCWIWRRPAWPNFTYDTEAVILGGMNAGKHIKLTGRSKPTATRDLAGMVAKGQLWTAGVGKAVRYDAAVPVWAHGVVSAGGDRAAESAADSGDGRDEPGAGPADDGSAESRRPGQEARRRPRHFHRRAPCPRQMAASPACQNPAPECVGDLSVQHASRSRIARASASRRCRPGIRSRVRRARCRAPRPVATTGLRVGR